MTSLLRVVISLAVVSSCLLEVFGSFNDSTEIIPEPRYHYKPHGHQTQSHAQPSVSHSHSNVPHIRPRRAAVTSPTVKTSSTVEISSAQPLDAIAKAREVLLEIQRKVADLVKVVRAKGPEIAKCSTRKISVVDNAFERAFRGQKACGTAFKNSTSPSTRTQDLDACLKKTLDKVQITVDTLKKHMAVCDDKTAKHLAPKVEKKD